MENSATPLILSVDDDAVLSVHVNSSLKKFYQVVSVNSAEAAFAFLKDKKVDLIVLDVLMPGMNGLQMYKLLRQDEATANIPVIFLTGSTDEELVEELIKSGADDFISKPVSPAELLMHVRNQLEKSKKK
ncbi:MAG: response regulator [Treponemataceae bacterium]|nr:response regulator [Treponemataceae bacterium]